MSQNFHALFEENQMKISRILALMPRTWILFLFILFSSSRSEGQTQPGLPPADLLCISDCETCPVICSPPPPATPKSAPPPPLHHASPPLPYYFDSPAPSSPPAHPLPPPPSYISWGGSANPPPPPPPSPPPSNTQKGGGAPPPPSVNVYNPGTIMPPGMGQRNYSYPYYYFYASKAAASLPLLDQGFILLMLFIFLQVLY